MLVPFSPAPGINSDDTTFSASGTWADGNNVRFRLGKPETIGGTVSLFTISGAGTPLLDIFAFTRSGAGVVAYGAQSGVYIGDLASATVRLASGGGYGYSFAAWGSTLLIADIGGKLYDQSGTSAAAEVTEAPDRIDAGILVSTQRQVLAFATNEVGGTFNPLCIRISNLEDYSSAGSWTPTSTNNAEEIILDNGGSIIAARLVGDYVAVWTQTDLHLGQFIGDPGQTYRFDHVADVPGPLTLRCIAEMNGAIYWMGNDFQLRVWSPGALPVVIPCPISRDFIDNFQSPAGSYMTPNSTFGEVWVFYKDSRDASNSYGSRYLAYAVNESIGAGAPIWFRGQLARSAMLDSEIVRGMSGNVFGLSLIGGTEAAAVYLHERRSVSDLSSYIQSADQYIDNSQRRSMVRSCIHDFEYNGGSVDLTLYMRDRPQSSPVTKGPYALSSITTKKDFRASGKIMAIKLSASVRWRLGKPLFDIVPMGQR